MADAGQALFWPAFFQRPIRWCFFRLGA